MQRLFAWLCLLVAAWKAIPPLLLLWKAMPAVLLVWRASALRCVLVQRSPAHAQALLQTTLLLQAQVPAYTCWKARWRGARHQCSHADQRLRMQQW